MHELLTPTQMARADALTIAGGISGIGLMNKAGLAVADEIATRHPLGARIGVVCGPGNNGGDGFVAARILSQRGYRVRIALLGAEANLTGDAALARAACRLPLESDGRDVAAWSQCTIDALFGAGLTRPIDGEAALWVAALNASNAEIVSVDLPSGVNGADGAANGAAVQADRTVTFFRKKPGHCLYPGKQYCGIVRVADIGIAARVLDEIKPDVFENAMDLWRDFWAPPTALGHKYSRGACVAVSGPPSATGAIRLAARAALRAGAGLVTIASRPDARAINAAQSTAVMTRCFDGDQEFADLIADPRLAAIIIGPGLGLGSDLADANRRLVLKTLQTDALVVLDADALTLFQSRPSGGAGPDLLYQCLAKRPPERTVLTPHTGEFARLFPDIAEKPGLSKIDRTVAAAHRANAVVLLKGADSVIAAPDGRAVVNHRASAWLATAGSGDVLAGILAGLGAQSIPGFWAACMAAHMHSAAGDQAGPGLIAEDLVEAIKPVIAAFDADFRSRHQKKILPGAAV